MARSVLRLDRLVFDRHRRRVSPVAVTKHPDNCFRGELSLCQYVISNDAPVTNPTNGQFRPIDRVGAIFINLQTQKIEGADMELVYRGDVDFFGDKGEDFAVRSLPAIWVKTPSRAKAASWTTAQARLAAWVSPSGKSPPT